MQKVIVFAILTGIIFTAGLIFLESREERFTSFYIYPDSYTNYPKSNTVSFIYGIRSFERRTTIYNLSFFIGNRKVNSIQHILDPGQILERPMTLDITGTVLPAQIRLVLTSRFDTYEVHYWLKENPPVAAFSAEPTSGKEPLTVSFRDLSTNNPKSWTWNFGDDTTSDLRNPTHNYSAGSYSVTLTASNSGGSNEDSKDNYIVVAPRTPPVAIFTADITRGKEPLTVNFTDQSTNSPTYREWDFGDMGRSYNRNPVHTYINPGNYTVKLTVVNPDGRDEEIKENYITVNPKTPPVASFDASPASGTEPLTVSFTDLSTNSPTKWTWDFGDGSTSTAQNPTHTYIAGTYTVQLTTSNADGSDKEVRENFIEVSPKSPMP